MATLSEIKKQLGIESLKLETVKDSNGITANWMRYWDSERRVRVSIPTDLANELVENPMLNNLRLEKDNKQDESDDVIIFAYKIVKYNKAKQIVNYKRIGIVALVVIVFFFVIYNIIVERKNENSLLQKDIIEKVSNNTIQGVDMSFIIPPNMKKSKIGKMDTYDSDDMTILFYSDKRGSEKASDGSTYFHEIEKYDINKTKEIFKNFAEKLHIKNPDIRIIKDESKKDTKIIVLETTNIATCMKMLMYETSNGNNIFVINSLNNQKAQEKVGLVEQSIILKELKYPQNKLTENALIRGTEIRLPIFDDYTNYYSNEKMKNFLLSIFDGENSGNCIAAYYNNRDTAKINKNIENNELNFPFDDYFYIGYPEGQNNENNTSNYLTLIDMMPSMFIEKNWDYISTDLNTKLKGLSKPILIDRYETSENIHTFIVLNKEEWDSSSPKLSIACLNVILLKDRIIYLSYYLNYEDEESIKKSKINNQYILYSFLEKNN